jgi:hypothetical protein
MVGRICERVEVGSQRRVSDTSRENTGRCEDRRGSRIDATEAQQAAAVSRMVAALLRSRFALMGAAIRAADAIDRVQRRKQGQEHGGHEPSHALIMVCF